MATGPDHARRGLVHTILRLHSPLQPYFDKTWRPSEFELVRCV
jgi:hypothetical protein